MSAKQPSVEQVLKEADQYIDTCNSEYGVGDFVGRCLLKLTLMFRRQQRTLRKKGLHSCETDGLRHECLACKTLEDCEKIARGG